MTNQVEIQSELSNWILDVKKCISSNPKGQFKTKGNLKIPFVFEWEFMSPNSALFNPRIRSLSDILAHTYAKLELQFAKKFPEAVPNEFFLKSLAPFFKEEKVDWVLIENKLVKQFQQFFTTTDFSQYSAESDIYLFVVAKDEKSGKIYGAIQFLISNDYAYGTVKACYFGILPEVEEQGIDKLLMGSIFKLLPGINRIFLHTRATNESVINNYMSWGFKQFNESMPNWPDFEYLSDGSEILQNVLLEC